MCRAPDFGLYKPYRADSQQYVVDFQHFFLSIRFNDLRKRRRHRANLRASDLSDLPMSWPVREALANDAFHGARRTCPVIHAESNAVAVAKIELGKIAVQVLLGTVLVDAL